MERKIILRAIIYLLFILILSGGYIYIENKIMANTIFPNKPLTLIVPFSAGGGMDNLARTLEKVAPKYLGEPLIVVNKLGGSGAIAWNELASAPPDGYTLAMTSPELLTIPLYGITKYHYPTALEPLVQISASPMVMVVHSEQPWQNLESLINYAKSHPEQLKFGHGGLGTLSNIIGETFASSTQISLVEVPFRGGSESANALLGKHIEIAIVNPLIVKEELKNGTLRALAVSSEHRLSAPNLAKIPTFKEQGFDIVFTNWYGVATPKDLAPEVKTTLAIGFKAMISDPEFKNAMDKSEVEIEYLDTKATANEWLKEREKLNKLLQTTGLVDLINNQKN